MEMLNALMMLMLVCPVICLVSAELPDEVDYDVTIIRQKTACPTIYCPWNCERYVDRNGCVYCGRCNPKSSCPPIKCPNLPYFGCVARVGRDGCTTCKCRTKSKPLEQLIENPNVSPVTNTPSVPSVVRPSFNIRPNRPFKMCRSAPMCSADCTIAYDANGCERCSCPPPLTQLNHCPEAPNAPCKRPDCFRERGADGCYHCICPDDVYSCPEVKCDPKKKCVHVVDHVTGCATGCQCEIDNNSSIKPNKPINNRFPIPLSQHPGNINKMASPMIKI